MDEDVRCTTSTYNGFSPMRVLGGDRMGENVRLLTR